MNIEFKNRIPRSTEVDTFFSIVHANIKLQVMWELRSLEEMIECEPDGMITIVLEDDQLKVRTIQFSGFASGLTEAMVTRLQNLQLPVYK
ncbi:MAG: hypothetical protein V4450_07195 [Bacteroidota bacterium]